MVAPCLQHGRGAWSCCLILMLSTVPHLAAADWTDFYRSGLLARQQGRYQDARHDLREALAGAGREANDLRFAELEDLLATVTNLVGDGVEAERHGPFDIRPGGVPAQGGDGAARDRRYPAVNKAVADTSDQPGAGSEGAGSTGQGFRAEGQRLPVTSTP